MVSPVLECQSLAQQIATVETCWQFGIAGVPQGPVLGPFEKSMSGVEQ